MTEQTPFLNLSLSSKNEKIYLEWQKFISGDNKINTDVVSPEILEAWIYCRNLKIDPHSMPDNPVLSGEDLQKKLAENALLIEMAQPILEELFRVSQSSFTVGLFDREGYLLQVLHQDQYQDANARFNWRPGVQWTEECAGNNTLSIVIRQKRPSRLIGAQHYKKILHLITASSAPILSPDGELLGGISLTTFLFITHPHTFGMAIAAAHAVENKIRAADANARRQAALDETDTMSSLQQAFVTYIREAMMAINSEGRIHAINDQARKVLRLEHEAVIGLAFKDIFSDPANQALLEAVESAHPVTDMEVRIRTSQGSADFALTCNPVLSASGATIGKILIFSEIQRIKSLVTKFIGAKANFTFSDICCSNERFRQIIDQAVVVSQSPSNILLLGESGTGKDIFAQAIHNASPRRDGPYIAINCAAIPRDLIASELFGYDEGAFTGSRRGGNQGKFELADGGTIFLDEIAETPLEIQAALLRVIEDKRVVRIGGSQIRFVDVRIISATNRDLQEEVNRGNFRKDLYYRLNVFNLQLPPLRDRLDEIPLMVEQFIRKYAAALGKNIRGMDDKAMRILMQHRFPGNVRELQNIVERMVNFADGEWLTADLIPTEIIDPRQIGRRTLDVESPESTEKRIIGHLLSLKFRKNQIAKQLNLSRTTLFRKMKKYGFLD